MDPIQPSPQITDTNPIHFNPWWVSPCVPTVRLTPNPIRHTSSGEKYHH